MDTDSLTIQSSGSTMIYVINTRSITVWRHPINSGNMERLST